MAVWPPSELVSQLRQLERPSLPGLRWTTEDQWHVTLCFLGEVGFLLTALESALDAAVAGLSAGPVQASAGPAPRSLGGHVWVLPVEGLDDLASAVRAACQPADRVEGGRAEGRAFRGHVTLARAKGRSSGGLLHQLPVPEVSCRWEPEEVTLVSSELRPSGARYEVIGRWQLPRR